MSWRLAPYRLDIYLVKFINNMDNERDIDEELRYGTKIISQLRACNKTLRDEQSKQTKYFEWTNKERGRERKSWEREKKWLERNSIQNINETQKLRTRS